MFALCSIDAPDPAVNLKCDPEKAIELREQYPDIKPAYHMNKKMWNGVRLNGQLNNAFLCNLIDHSYQEVIKTFSLKKRRELGL